MDPLLADLLRQFDAVRDDARRLTAGLTEAQLRWQPKPAAWSIVDNFAHLVLVDSDAATLIEPALAEARRNGITANGPVRYGPIESLFVRIVEPPPRLRVPAPKKYHPPAQWTTEHTLAEFFRTLETVRHLAAESDGLDLGRVKVRSPARLRFRLGKRLQLVAAHDRRHLYQAWQVRKAAGFPG